MRILVVSQYYRPEAGATQNRMGAFVDGLVDRGHAVTVVCEQPNHPAGVFQEGFGRRPVVTERRDGHVVRRLWVAASPRKTTLRRLAFYGTFAAGTGAAVGVERRHDVLFATSPPLPGAAAAAAAARLRRMPFVLDVRDLWPAAAEALGELSNLRALRAFEGIERWLYDHAAAVTTTTRSFCSHIDRVAERPCAAHLPNGALDELLDAPAPAPSTRRDFTLGYVGNIGIAQGLNIVLDAAEHLQEENVRLLIVGDGPVAREMRAETDRRSLDRVVFQPPVPVSEVGNVLLSCNALLVPLRAHAMLEQFVPSKLYDAMAVARPVIVAAGGEAAELVREAECGLVVPPEDGRALAEAVRTLAADPSLARRLGDAGRRVARRHARSLQVEHLEQILEAAATPPSIRPRAA